MVARLFCDGKNCKKELTGKDYDFGLANLHSEEPTYCQKCSDKNQRYNAWEKNRYNEIQQELHDRFEQEKKEMHAIILLGKKPKPKSNPAE